MEKENRVDDVIAAYRKRINDNPVLLSLLYDANLLLGQIVTMHGAISMAAVAEAFEFGAADWQPIETAPLNHFPVLTWSLQQGQCVAFLDVAREWWSAPNGDVPMRNKPTHWMPLPKSPVQS